MPAAAIESTVSPCAFNTASIPAERIEDVPPSVSDRILRSLNNMLCERFAIRHTTVQFEHVGCAVAEIGCGIPSGSHAHHQH